MADNQDGRGIYAGDMPLKQIERGLEGIGENKRDASNEGFNDRANLRGGAQQQAYDENEFSGILSSPGLCGNNSLLQRQDDVMNNFLQNLKERVENNEDENNASQDKFLNDLISSKSRLQTQSQIGFSQIKSGIHDRQGSAHTQKASGDPGAAGDLKSSQKSPGAGGSSPAVNFLKQSQFSDYNEDNNQMSQLGQFAQLSYLLNNLNSKQIQNAAMENFKNDKSLLNHINSQSLSNPNMQPGDGQHFNVQSQFLANPSSQQLLSQLSQFGLLKTQGNQAENKPAQGNEIGDLEKQVSNPGNLELEELQVSKKPPAPGANLKGSSILKASAFEGKGSSVTSLPTTNRNLMGGDLSFKNEELRQEEQNRQNQQKLLAQRRQESVTDCQRAPDGRKEAYNELKEISGEGSFRSNRWLAERSKRRGLQASSNDQKDQLQKQEDDLKVSQGDKNSDQECDQYFESMQKLMSEKERLNQEQEKIRQNKFLKMVDRSNAIKSVRSLSRTIEDLIAKEKEKITDHYQSKLSKSKASNLTQSRAFSGSQMEQEFRNQFGNDNDPAARHGFATTGHPLPNDEIGESQLKFSTLTKTTIANQPNQGTGPQRTMARGVSPGGTTDSLQFSQSVALSNLATTIRQKGAQNPQGGSSQNRQAYQSSRSRERMQPQPSSAMDQNRELEFGDLGKEAKIQAIPTQLPLDQQDLVTLQQRSELIFSDISDMHDKIKLKNAEDSGIDDLQIPNNVHADDRYRDEKQGDQSFPPTITHENFQADMLASLRKRASIDQANDHLINDTPIGSQEFADSQLSGFGVDNPENFNDPQKQTIEQSIQSAHHLDCVKQYSGGKNRYQRDNIDQYRKEPLHNDLQDPHQDSNFELELLILKREKDQLAHLNKQLEQKLALKDQQLQNHQKQLQLRQKAHESLAQDSKNQLANLEHELQSQHESELMRIKDEHAKELQSASMKGGNEVELQEIKELNQQLMKENEYLREAKERYQILQRSFNQLEHCSINSEVEERLRPMIDQEVLRYRDQNEQLIAQNEEILNEMQRLEDRVKQAESSNRDSELTIQKQRDEIKLKEKLLDEARNQSIQHIEKEKDTQDRLLKKLEVKDSKATQELAQYKGQLQKKDQQIKQLQESITQLENGLNQITNEAKNVIQKNTKLRRENDELKVELQNKHQDKALLIESQQQKSTLKQNQQIIKQLKDTIKAQKDLIKQMETQNQQFESSLLRERAENEKLIAKIDEQSSEIYAYEKSKETADKAARNLSTLDRDDLVKQLDMLKAVEQKQKRKLTAMQTEINDHLKDISETNQKYSKQLEMNGELRKQLDESTEQLSAIKLENSQLKLQLQEKSTDLKETRQKLEQKFIQQDKVIQHKQRQIDDLKDSIALKITVADDLQKLLQEQKKQLQETRTAQLLEFERAKEDLEESKKKTQKERDEILQKLWTSQSAVEQLKTLNMQILGDMDQLKKSIRKQSHGSQTTQKSENNRSTTPTKQTKRSRSRSKSSKDYQIPRSQPLIEQLDNLKSNYITKMASIQTDMNDRDNQGTRHDYRNDALNLAQLTKASSPSPAQERPGHMTFAQEGEEHESPNQRIKIEDRKVSISSENEFRFTKAKKDFAREHRDFADNEITERSQKDDNTTFNLETYLHPTNPSSLIDRQMMKLKQSQQSKRSKNEKLKSSLGAQDKLSDGSFETYRKGEDNEAQKRADLTASINSFITKEQQQLTTSRLQREIQGSSARRGQINEDLDFVENEEQAEMQESVSDILKKFKEDQERIMNEGLMTGTLNRKKYDDDNEFISQQPEQMEYDEDMQNQLMESQSSANQMQKPQLNQDLYDDLDQEPTSQKNFQEYIDMFENYVNTFGKK